MDKFRKCLRFVSCSTVKGKEESEQIDLDVPENQPLEESEQIVLEVPENQPLDYVLEDELQLKRVFEVFTYVVAQLSSLKELPLISENSPWADQMMEKIQSCKSGLAFLGMFLWSRFRLDDTLEDIWGIETYQVSVFFTSENTKLEIEHWILDLENRIQNCKLKYGESCELLLNSSLRYNPHNDSTVEFVANILFSLKNLNKFKTDDEILLVNNQLATLENKLTLLHNLFDPTRVQWGDYMELEDLQVVVRVFVQYSASLVFLYWVKDVDEETAIKLNIFLSDVLLKYKLCVAAFKDAYLRFLEENKLMQIGTFLLREIIQIFVDLLLESLVTHISKEDFQILQESLFFVIHFLANPPDLEAEDEELIMLLTAEMEALVKVNLYHVLSIDYTIGNFSEANTHLSDFLRKVELVKGLIQQVYVKIRDSFSYDFPKINGLGFFDFTLQNLGFIKEKLKSDTTFIPFAKHLIIQIEEELTSLRPYLDGLFEQQKAQKELKDTWLKVIDLAYRTEYAINLCSVIGHPIWYNMARLMEVLDEIKVVNNKLKKIIGGQTHDGANLHCSAVAPNRAPESPQASGFNEVMVDLKEELEMIVDNLKCGSESLDIVAIVGMAGLGKTTMAKKVYNTPEIRHHFHIVAYCIVSQAHNARKMLLDILADIEGKDDKMNDMTEEDLADKLRRCLKGKRYLIIMDDVWDVKAWNDVERSFPNDRKGSRVLFTTRIHYVALQTKKDCKIHQLRFLSEEESWELLWNKAFNHAEVCPPGFSEVGKMIANNCNGLPLTIVLIGGLLAKTERSLSWWYEISETISSYVSTEGGMDVLELSYQHLPEHLKSCFLYFGAFEEDAIIHVNKLTLLWITEGFVQNSNRGNLKNVAYKYLSDLADRSLVIANKRSSYGGIKSCQMHDLVHEFCRKKAHEENIFQLMVNNEPSNSSSSILRNPYRVCVHTEGKYVSDDATDIHPRIHSLHFSSGWEIRRRDHYDLTNLKLVQVMDLEELDCYESFLREMQSIVHLRFMSVSFHPKWSSRGEILLFTLNDFISNRWNLEVLILKGPLIGEIPEAFWNLARLRHVDVIMYYQNNSGVKKREAYPQMVNLESFSSLRANSIEDLEVLLQRSPSLRKLSFHCTDNARESIHFPKLDSLSKLESLKVESVGEACLRSFNLLSSLKKLSIAFSRLDWSYLTVISKMPCLEVLKLHRESFVGPEWDTEDTEFPKLKFLELSSLDFQEWIAYSESFPSLEVFIMDECDQLNTIPSCFGEMLTLKRIGVYASNNAASASVVEIEESQKDFGNEELQVIVSERALVRWAKNDR